MNKLISHILSTSFCLVLIILFPLKPYGQYNLPKRQLLIKDSIKVIHVTKTSLRKENRNQKTISSKSFVKNAQLLSSYFINASGRVDSVYHYYADTSKYNKEIFSFGLDKQLQEIKLINPDGKTIQRTLLERTPEKEFHLRTWNRETLTYDLKATKDSIIYETTTYHSFNPLLKYKKILYNLKEETISNINYVGEEIVLKETYEWFTKNAEPYLFKYSKYNYKERGKEPEVNFIQYKVASDGSIMSKNKGLFTDPFHSYNYYTWQKRYNGLRHPLAYKLRNVSLFAKQEYSEVYDFDGNAIIYGYTMEYEKHK